MSQGRLSHLDDSKNTRIPDIGRKPSTDRITIASAMVRISPELMKILKENKLAKGNALTVARVAGIQAAKRTDQIIPMCHSLPLSHVDIELTLHDVPPSVQIMVEVKTTYKSGAEMEALAAASVTALTIYDMCKAVDKGIVIEHVRLESKSDGEDGNWQRSKH